MATLKDGTITVAGRTSDGTKLNKVIYSPNKSLVGKFVDSENLNKWSLGGTPTFYGNSLGMASWQQTTATPPIPGANPAPTAPASGSGGYSVQSTNGSSSQPMTAMGMKTLVDAAYAKMTEAQSTFNPMDPNSLAKFNAAMGEYAALDAAYKQRFPNVQMGPTVGDRATNYETAPASSTGWDAITGGSFNTGTIPGTNPAPGGNVTTTMTPQQMQQNQNNGNPSANLPAAPPAQMNQEQITEQIARGQMDGYNTGSGATSGGAAGGGAIIPAVTSAVPAGTAATSAAGAAAGTIPWWLGPAAAVGGGIIGAGGSIIAANTQANAAQQAAQTTANANTQAAQFQQEALDKILAAQKTQYDTTRADWAPWRDAGAGAINDLKTFWDNNPDFGMSQFQADPGYSFRLSEGLKALQNSAAARGNLLSGNTLKGIQNYGQEAASQEYQNAFNRYNTNRGAKLNHLQSLAGMNQTAIQQTGQAGQNYTNNVGQAGQTYANNMGQLAQNYGNAQANGIAGAANANASAWVGGANALTQALSGAYNNYLGQQAVNSLGGY